MIADYSMRQCQEFWGNPTLYRIGESYRYYDLTIENTKATTNVSRVARTEYLDYLIHYLDRIAAPVSYLDVVGALHDHLVECSETEIMNYVDELIDNSILVSSWALSLTDGEPFDQLIRCLKNCPGNSSKCSCPRYLKQLEEIEKELAILNKATIGNGIDAQVLLDSKIRRLIDVPGLNSFIQTDMHFDAVVGKPSTAYSKRIASGIRALLVISKPRETQLETFRQEFQRRFGEQFIPIAEVLDPDQGIGFGAPGTDELPMLDRVHLEQGVSSSKKTVVDRPAVTKLLSRKLEQLQENGKSIIHLSREDLDKLMIISALQIPDSFCVGVSIVDSDDAQTSDHAVVIRFAYGPSGASLISRFCTADAKLGEYTEKFIAEEEALVDDSTVEIVEVNHWPEELRHGNLTVRPRIRYSEVSICARPATTDVGGTRIHNILIGVEDGDIVLVDRRSGKRLLPRLTTAHNFGMSSNSIYRFLGALQRQESSIVSFSWPQAFEGRLEFPRIESEGCVISPRHWRIPRELFSHLSNLTGFKAYEALERWRVDLDLPQNFELVVGDLALPIDLTSPICADCFLAEIKGAETAHIREMFSTRETGFASDHHGNTYSHELLLPFLRQKTPNVQDRSFRKVAIAGSNDSSVFPPGTKWVYFKVYCGTASADRVLVSLEKPIRDLIRAKAINRWFFLRYFDHDFHLRIRLECDNEEKPSEIQGIFCDYLISQLKSGSAWTFEQAMYEREIDRYGGRTAMLVAEDLFWISSDFVIDMLRRDDIYDPKVRMIELIRSLDWLWTCAIGSNANKHKIFGEIAMRLAHRYSVGKSTKISIDKKFREIRRNLEGALFNEIHSNDQHAHFLGKDIDAAMRDRFRVLRQSISSKTAPSYIDVVCSLAHMHVNRLAVSRNTEQEFVAYELLKRAYYARSARSGGHKNRLSSI